MSNFEEFMEQNLFNSGFNPVSPICTALYYLCFKEHLKKRWWAPFPQECLVHIGRHKLQKWTKWRAAWAGSYSVESLKWGAERSAKGGPERWEWFRQAKASEEYDSRKGVGMRRSRDSVLGDVRQWAAPRSLQRECLLHAGESVLHLRHFFLFPSVVQFLHQCS